MTSNIRMLVDQLNVSAEIAPADAMYFESASTHYFSVGRSALRAVMSCLAATEEYGTRPAAVETILDYGCGHGRVCRYLRAAYPTAEISVADVDPAAAQFCADTFGCTNIGLELPADSFDLIWVGSVLTHLSELIAKNLLYALASAVRPNGVLVFTTHGRFSHARHYCNPQAQHYMEGRINNDRIAAGYLATGFGFSSHANRNELSAATDPGISIIDPRWIHQLFFACTGLMQVFFQERGWDHHQDVYGYARYELLG